MNDSYMLSVIMLTFNHEKYINQALDSILMQEVSFEYEILIGDDFSTDNTRAILQSYQEKYPTRIKLFFHKENLGASRNIYELLMKAQGKYIANLEGDDFWTSPHKLQQQVDFLETHQEYIACFHKCMYVDVLGDRIPTIKINGDYSNKEFFDLKDFERELPGQTATNLYRNIYLMHPEYDYTCIYKLDRINSDKTIWLLLLNIGSIYIMPDVMSCYRYIVSPNSENASSLYQRKKDSLFIYLRKLEELSKSMFGTEVNFISKKKSYLFQALYSFIHKRNSETFKCLINIVKHSESPVYYGFLIAKYIIHKGILFVFRPATKCCIKIRSKFLRPVFQQLYANTQLIKELKSETDSLQTSMIAMASQLELLTKLSDQQQQLEKCVNSFIQIWDKSINAYQLPVQLPPPNKQDGIQFGAEALYKLVGEYDFKTVLDIGCGNGKHSDYLLNAGKTVTSIDIGNSIYFKHNNASHTVIIGDFNTYSFDKQFDCIWCSHVLEHQLNVHQFLKKIHLLLKENGILAITVPPAKALIVGGHLSMWNAGLVLYNLVLAGFDCSNAAIKEYNYNISVIVVKKSIDPLSMLSFDAGDISIIKKYLPASLSFYNTGIDTPFNGHISEINWR